ncbi:hypothetical protein LUX29_12120 [Aureimonas altamirensis]|uniref:hypothetical protein n=1 Tax=Aureimonas altamirensis TaxID=370622 RepID=UPI001E3A3F27|nr:hypothetical protein [Aureimonas altamirensis]UHD43845.1 hypothetical protein LUX29_12120 [Aureimonas altamirensis]
MGIQIASLFIGVLFLFASGLQWPSLIVEDGVIESISAAFFAMASMIAFVRVLTSTNLTRSDRILLALIVPFGALLALSEVSFGARIGLVSPPDMYGGGQFDGGHDVVILTLRLMRDNTTFAMLALIVVLAASVFFGSIIWRRRTKVIAIVRSNATEMSVRFSFTVGILAVALGLDLIPSWKAGILEEMLELTASIVLIVTVLTRAAGFRSGAHSGPLNGRRDHSVAGNRTRQNIRFGLD